MTRLVVFAIWAGPGLLIAAVPGPTPPPAPAPADEARAVTACLVALASTEPPDPARVLDAWAANEELGAALLDAEACRDDRCARYLPPLLEEKRRARDAALEALRPKKGP